MKFQLVRSKGDCVTIDDFLKRLTEKLHVDIPQISRWTEISESTLKKWSKKGSTARFSRVVSLMNGVQRNCHTPIEFDIQSCG